MDDNENDTAGSTDERYTLISADCHGGGAIGDYREYLPKRFHDEFDAWAGSYVIEYEDLLGELGERNWDSKRRLADLEADGVVAEVIYPNTIPPFYPKSSLTFQPPAQNAGDAEKRWAGLQAHNRWLADFCNEVPGRRAGIAQVLLGDIPAAVAEVRWAKEAGLTGGILLPGVPPNSGLPELYDGAYYEPLWAVCAELGMPVNHHGGSASPPMTTAIESPVVFLLEVTWFSHRALTHLIVSGALERHPELQVVFTEQGTAWIPEELARLDYFFNRMRTAVGSQEHVWGKPVTDKLTLTPSEYFARQCSVGASFIRPSEVPLRHTVGLEKIMWGTDYPHKEASTPYTLEALRAAFAGVPHHETAMMLGGNAARIYGFDLELLEPIAAQIGPRKADVDVPLQPGDVPMVAEKCPALAGFGAR
ncbi:MAG: amidohydrolase 2 [Acidimicrobiales bacterium]|nr:amidohydrolase 2 [Acidimicrobiales bacterium]